MMSADAGEHILKPAVSDLNICARRIIPRERCTFSNAIAIVKMQCFNPIETIRVPIFKFSPKVRIRTGIFN